MKPLPSAIPASVVLPMLTKTALERGTAKGHTFGPWQSAKRRFGKGAVQTICELCGLHATAMPYGEASANIAVIRYNPGLQGAALTEPCVSTSVIDPPPGVLGLF